MQAAIITALSWSFLAILLKFSLSFASAGTVVWFRFTVAAICLLIYFAIKKRGRILNLFKQPLKAYFASICLAGNYYGYMKGVEYTNASNTQIFIQIGPVALALYGIFYFKEKLNLLQTFGLIIATIGYILFYQDQFKTFDLNPEYLIGIAWIIFAAITWVFYSITQRSLSGRHSPLELNFVTFITASIATISLANFSEVPQWELSSWPLIIYLGINTIIAYACLSYALQTTPMSIVSPIISMNPLLTIVILIVMEKFEFNFVTPEPLSITGHIGAILVTIGVITIVSKNKSKKI